MTNSYLKLILCDDFYVLKSYVHSNFSEHYNIDFCDSLLSHKNEFFSKSIFNINNTKKCYVIYNEKELDTLLDKFDDLISGKYQNNNVVLYRLSSIDKRSKIYKKYKNIIVEPIVDIEKEAERIFNNKFNKEDKKSLMTLFKTCNQSISRTVSELNKAKAYLDINNNISIKDSIDTILSVIVSIEEVDTFDFIDAILSKNKDKIKYYLKLIDTSEFDFGLLTLLYNNFRGLCSIKEAANNATPENTGISQFMINNYRNNVSKYSQKELNNILKMLYNIDKNIKTGELDSSYAYDLMLVEILQ